MRAPNATTVTTINPRHYKINQATRHVDTYTNIVTRLEMKHRYGRLSMPEPRYLGYRDVRAEHLMRHRKRLFVSSCCNAFVIASYERQA